MNTGHIAEHRLIYPLLSFFFSMSFIFTVNLGDDCPVFDGLFEFCSISAGGSIGKQQESGRPGQYSGVRL